METLIPPAPPAPEDAPTDTSKRSEAVFIASRMLQIAAVWTREVTYFYEGDEYAYGLQALKADTEEAAQRVLCSERANKDLHNIFLRDVRLDMTRPH